MKWKKSVARMISNSGLSFFGPLVTFNFATEFPTEQIIIGSGLYSLMMFGVSAMYELRRYSEMR